MGVMKFLVPQRERLPADVLQRAYLVGMDEIPWQTRSQWAGDLLLVERAEHDSGNLQVPYVVEGQGELLLSTASLMERERPYHLTVELARGTLNRLRNQVALWESMGMRIGPTVSQPMVQASEHFASAATHQHDAARAADSADRSLGQSLSALRSLCASYVEQVLSARHQQSGKLNTLWGVNLGNTRLSDPMTQRLAQVFNTAQVPLRWRDVEVKEGQRDWTLPDAQIEWARAAGMKVVGGPLLSIDKWSLPDWMYVYGADDVDSFRSCVAEQISAVVDRYRGKVHLWQCAARLNVENEFGHDEEERLRLAVLSIEAIRRIDTRTPIVLLVDQPWGSFMSRQDCDLSPLHFADALVRGDLGLAGIGLELNIGYLPNGCDVRDVLEFGRQMDRWSSLGLPLMVSLTVPGGDAQDPLARVAERIAHYAPGGALSSATQRTWAEQYLPMLIAKQPVQAMLWNQLLDSQPHPLAFGGLFDAHDKPKPIVELLEKLRRDHLV